MPITIRFPWAVRISSKGTPRALIAYLSTTADSSPSSSQPDVASRYQRREGHKPRSGVPEEDETYHVITLQTDLVHYRTMCALRERYYPPSLFRVQAHISLFHALPGSMLSTIKTDITATVGHTAPFNIRAVGPPIRLGQGGVGVSVSGLGPVERLVSDFQDKWQTMLSRQDRGAFRGHYTLMNKVDNPEAVTRCLEEVRRELEPVGCPGTALGLSLWRYDNGWWRHEEDFRFCGAEDRGP